MFDTHLPDSEAEHAEFADKRILIVDDSPSIRAFLRNLLTTQGAAVEVAETGQGALAFLQPGRPPIDMILLDLLLPDIDGIKVLERLRQINDDCTVVMVTGSGGVKSAIAAIRAGADGYVEKQDLVVGGDYAEFYYALEQALKQRAGLAAQRQLQQVKADFYSMVTHDLRNPTSSILLTMNMLLDEDAGPLTTQQRNFLALAHAATEKLLGLINDYLDFAKIDAGFLQLSRGEAELRGLVEASVRLTRLQAETKGLDLAVELPSEALTAVVDAERLQQVFDNLLSNAVKYTPPGGSIRVQLHLDDGRHNVLFRVADSGKGIPADQLPALFTKYHRVPGQATRGIRGTGLGLLIVKEIVEAHGGMVTAESEGLEGQGATFTVRFPWRLAEHGAAPS